MEKDIKEYDERRINRVVQDVIAKRDNQQTRTVLDGGRFRPVEPEKNYTLARATEVEIKEPEWLIPGYIPRYGITTIAGEGGVGKTSIWCDIVASITTGKPSFLLGNREITTGKPEDVVVLSAEDSWSYVLKKRLENNGADLKHVYYMGTDDPRFNELNFNSDMLDGIMQTNCPNLVIFDPVQSFVPENLRMGDRNAMRKCFTPLIGYGEAYKVTSIIIAHANKQSSVWGRKRIADSSDIWDASRSILMTGTVPNQDGLRYISHEKSNWGKLQDSVLFRLDDGVPVFQAYTKNKDREFVLMDSKFSNEIPVCDVAKDFILNTLDENCGQLEVKELDQLAKSVGISSHSLKDAKMELNKETKIRTWSTGYGKGKKYIVSLTDTLKTDE